MHELPLILFTLLLQCSVGITIGLAITHRRAVAAGDVRRTMLWPLVISFILAAIGLTASTLHLGYPLNAFNALRHVASSWLSREIVFASFYLAALGLSVVVAFIRKPGWQFLLWLAALLGAVDVFCMAQIYIHTGVISWQHVNTLVMFAGTVGTLGAVALAALRGMGVLPSQALSLRWALGAGRHRDRYAGPPVDAACLDAGYHCGGAKRDVPSRSLESAAAASQYANCRLVRERAGHAVLCLRGASQRGLLAGAGRRPAAGGGSCFTHRIL